jgi:hypothetical protein
MVYCSRDLEDSKFKGRWHNIRGQWSCLRILLVTWWVSTNLRAKVLQENQPVTPRIKQAVEEEMGLWYQNHWSWLSARWSSQNYSWDSSLLGLPLLISMFWWILTELTLQMILLKGPSASDVSTHRLEDVRAEGNITMIKCTQSFCGRKWAVSMALECGIHLQTLYHPACF